MKKKKADVAAIIEELKALYPDGICLLYTSPYLKTSVWEIYKKRVLWLLLLMVSAAFTGAIITHYETALAAQVVLTAFIPMLMDTGGNCGSQSSVTIIRGLSLGEIGYGDWWKVAWKEIQVGVLCGITLAAVNLLRLTVLDHLDLIVAIVVSLTLVVTVIVSKDVYKRQFVVKLCGLDQTQEVNRRLWAESGISLARLAWAALGRGLAGLEFAHGIPGSLGGGVMMNAGAYGGELSQVVTAVTYLDGEGNEHTCLLYTSRCV